MTEIDIDKTLAMYGFVAVDARELADLHATNSNLMQALEKVEWIEITVGHTGWTYKPLLDGYCPWCGGMKSQGHKYDCTRQIVLNRFECAWCKRANPDDHEIYTNPQDLYGGWDVQTGLPLCLGCAEAGEHIEVQTTREKSA